MDSNGAIESFIEKPKDGTFDGSTNTINAGIYILEPGTLDLIPKGVNSSFEYDVFPKALEQKLSFSGYVLEENYWQDIGTPQS
jgi:NDP-sugar pyrophosphorylase family protein